MQVENLKCCNSKIDFEKKRNTEYELSPRLKDSIKDIVEREGYSSYALYVNILPVDGGNSLATLVEINVNGTTKSGEKTMNFFVKNILPDENFTLVSITEVYNKEMFAYNELFKIYTHLQNEAEIPPQERFRITKSYDKTSAEFIILENITKKGFKTLNRMDILPLRFVELAIQQLAKFHGLSFVLQKKHKDYFNTKIKSLNYPSTFNDEWKKFMVNFIKISFEHVNCETEKKIEGLIPAFKEKYPRYYTDEAPVMCICHGDYKSNNIMFKINEEEISEVIPIDYQIIHYGCPINDIFYLIYAATDRQFRTDHLENIKNMYHDTLKKFLVYFDMDVEDYFPKKMFEDLYRERMEYALMTAIWLLPVIMLSEDNIPDFSKDKMSDFVFKVHENIKPRMEEIVDEFFELGYL